MSLEDSEELQKKFRNGEFNSLLKTITSINRKKYIEN